MLKIVWIGIKSAYKKGEGRFSFTFLRRDISPATAKQLFVAIIIVSYLKNNRKLCLPAIVFAQFQQAVRYAVYPFCPLALPRFPGTFHPAHSNQQGKLRRIGAPHESPGIQYIY